jgi:hypothetical protein
MARKRARAACECSGCGRRVIVVRANPEEEAVSSARASAWREFLRRTLAAIEAIDEEAVAP